jgi:hypothetical protein
MINWWVVALILLIILCVWHYWGQFNYEGYSNLSKNMDFNNFRTYSSDPYDFNTLTSFPYTYFPNEYNQQFTCVTDHDVYYGYGLQ